jgi:hypothetical protein
MYLKYCAHVYVSISGTCISYTETHKQYKKPERTQPQTQNAHSPFSTIYTHKHNTGTPTGSRASARKKPRMDMAPEAVASLATPSKEQGSVCKVDIVVHAIRSNKDGGVEVVFCQSLAHVSNVERLLSLKRVSASDDFCQGLFGFFDQIYAYISGAYRSLAGDVKGLRVGVGISVCRLNFTLIADFMFVSLLIKVLCV